jgi:hypothetical protein
MPGETNKTSRFIVTGGLQRANAVKLGEGRRFHTARLLSVDFNTRETSTLISYEGTPGCYPDEFPNILFTAATLDNNRLYLCAETEIFLYDYPSLRLLNKVSYPFFQNVHHVAPVLDYVGVASTGLDMVVLLDRNTLEPVRFINSLGKDPWHRFSRNVDYRLVHSTKPHESHPNFVFAVDDEVWATRFKQKDAISLDDPSKRIDIGIERVHDGHVMGDYAYFTTVNGNVVIANIHTRVIEDIIDLNQIEKQAGPLGWCRGLSIVDGLAYVGFSRLRDTVARENIKWAMGLVKSEKPMNTRICVYDLAERRKLDEYIMPRESTNVIYSVLPGGLWQGK